MLAEINALKAVDNATQAELDAALETVNGNIGRIYIDKVDSISGNFCQMTLHLKDMPTSANTKSAKYSFKYMPSIIPSAVKAIFKNDPHELDKVTIKYNG